MLVDSEGRGSGQNTERADDSSVEWTDGIGKYTGLGAMSRGALGGSFGVSGGDGVQAQGDPPGKGKKGQTSSDAMTAINQRNYANFNEQIKDVQVSAQETGRFLLELIDTFYDTNLSGTNYDPNQKYIGGGVPSLGVGGGAAKGVASGSQYSVAFETKLASNLYTGKGYYSHFKAANTSLSNATADGAFANLMSKLDISVPRSSTGNILGKSPANWVWHHDVDAGVMQLVPKAQHTTGSMFWNTMHPSGVGGMSIWGK